MPRNAMTIVEELRIDRESGARRLESEYKAGLMTLARRFCADEGDAEELVNRTLAAVVEGIDDYLEQSAFFGWMCKILENIHAKDVRRKSSRTVAGDAEAVAGARDDEAEDRIFREVDASLLRDAIAELPADLKDALMLRYFMDLPVSRVARILAAPEGTVKWRLHCARMVLAAKLGAQSPGVRMLLLALLLAAGLAVGGGVYALATAAASRAESAEFA
ncbi:MAG: sigma-70 family RNA polymerase sigma factor, partial [Kiritimatiellae bacterium]|nr:sigma-70 family RNA polymerase sigma factor [Kiritimatiellia bacterium]